MSDTLSETEACDLLARLFKGRGYAIARNVTFREYGVEFHIDGWDAKARVGFEFLTSEDDDHDDLSLGEYQTLSAAQLRGELSLFILDEVEPLSAADLAEMANEFLDEVAAAKRPGRKVAAARTGPAPRKKKAAAGKKASPKKKNASATTKVAAKKTKKPSKSKKPATKRPKAKKPAPKKRPKRK